MLDADPLTAHDIASAATWADRYRDSDRNNGITSKRGVGTSSMSNSPIRTSTPRASGTRPLWSRRMARRKRASSIRSSNSRPNYPITEPIPRNGSSRSNSFLHLVGDLYQPLHAADDQTGARRRCRD